MSAMKKLTALKTAVIASLISSGAYATGGTFDSITGAVDLAEVQTAIMAIGVVLAGFYVARKGLNLVLGMLKSKS